MVGQHHGVVVARGLGGRVGDLLRAGRVEGHPAGAAQVVLVVQGREPQRHTEHVDEQHVLRVQVHDAGDVGAHGIRALVQLPLHRRARRTADLLPVEGELGEVVRR